ncbi:lipopolysaccharide biosynthesis protein [Nocardioides sp. Soil805]|uniref:lipopolysaccharide biosynthesis protein n=1 Tax=Nocardioides sp. Soil805 TaxID=1736416 RepID=UPI00070300BF|nr:oligosaccharide flippase family protein [Nocardioides sp. Soil805]KRF34321.1 polysaccharide biosynthesis protein [Nocardioides sp. Soil805]
MAVIDRVRSLAQTSAGIAVAMAVMNVATYGFTMLATYLLGPKDYGALIAAMNFLIVVSVLSLGLQATAARRISADPGHVAQIERSIMRVTHRGAVALGLVLLVLTPAIDRLLRLDSLPTTALIAVAAVPLTIMGGQAGILQGERRWGALGLVYVAAGVPRLVIATTLVVLAPGEFTALLGVTIAFFVPALVGWWALRTARQPGEVSDTHRGRAIVTECLHNSQALLAFFALSNVDIIVARNVLPDHDSGLYAAGLIITKAMLFLPQFVVVVAFPALATVEERRRALVRSLVLIGGLGLVGTVATWLLAPLAMVFAGGAEFDEIQPYLWLFAIIGTLLSMIQLLVYSVLARQGRWTVLSVWVALACVVGLGLTRDSIIGLAVTVASVDAVLLGLLLGAAAYFLRTQRAELPEPAHTA